MFRPGFTCLAVLWILRSCQNFYLRDSHTLRLAFPCHSVNSSSLKSSPYPERISPLGLPSSAFARHYLRNLVWCLFLALLRCFSSGGSLDIPILKFSITYLSMNPGEFPHSEISGSMLICSSPKLIAAYHVFHRLPVPRHSPCALVRLTFQTFFQNIWYPLDSLFCQRRLLLPFLLKLQYFLKKNLL